MNNKTEKGVGRDEIYMEVAKQFSRRSTCLRKSVGACLVRDNHILGTGYNGAARTQAECIDNGCLLMDSHCVRTVHAEVNAVLSAAYNGVSTKGATLYTTSKPCFRCESFIINAGITMVVYGEEYDDDLNNVLYQKNMLRKYYGDYSKSSADPR